MDIQKMYYGDNESLSNPINVKIGPIAFIFQNGMIRSIMWHDVELVRRIYMALRDSLWNTIPYTITSRDLQRDENTFSLSFNANHLHKSINFQWRGLIECCIDGTLRFQMWGKALSSFERNRIGLCLLFPLSYSGKPVSIVDHSNATVNGTFPVQIAPHQPFKDVNKIRGIAEKGIQYDITFEGDVFEMEDQRNWTDASYKVYSTPLELPIPVTVHENDTIYQSITFKIQQNNYIESNKSDILTLSIPQHIDPVSTFPVYGLTDHTTDPLYPPMIDTIKYLQLHHCRYDLYIDNASLQEDLNNIVERSSLIKCQIELALHCTILTPEKIVHLLTALKLSEIQVYRFCIYDENKVTSLETLKTIVTVLNSYFPDSLIASGTDNYFVEINRNHPPLFMVDQVCYSANPQVHTFDHVAIMENLEGLEQTLKNVPLFTDNLPVIITPVTMRPRKNPKNPLKDGGSDIRQQGLFCASWTAGVMIRAAVGKAASITLYDIVGNGGLIFDNGSSVFPAFVTLLWLREFSGKPVTHCQSNSPLIEALLLHDTPKKKLLIVNYSDQIQHIEIQGIPEEFASKALDQNSFEAATSNPIAWNSIRPEYHLCEDHCWRTELLPYAVMMVSLS